MARVLQIPAWRIDIAIFDDLDSLSHRPVSGYTASVKVSVIAGFYPPDIRGGGEISGKLLVDHLSVAGAEVNVISCGADARTELEGAVKIRRVKSPNIYWSFESGQPSYEKAVWHFGENFNPRSRIVLKRLLKAIDPHIVVTNTIQNFGAEAWNAPKELDIPVVHILRGYYPFCWRSSAVRNGKNCKGQCLDCGILTYGRRRASQHGSGIIGTSKYVLDRHIAEGLFSSARQAIIPVPITTEAFARQSRTSHAARFGYLGVLSPDKGLETLASAWSGVDPARWTLSIAGRGSDSYVTAIRQQFGSSVAFLGWTESSAFLDTIDYLIVPSIGTSHSVAS